MDFSEWAPTASKARQLPCQPSVNQGEGKLLRLEIVEESLRTHVNKPALENLWTS